MLNFILRRGRADLDSDENQARRGRREGGLDRAPIDSEPCEDNRDYGAAEPGERKFGRENGRLAHLAGETKDSFRRLGFFDLPTGPASE